MKTIYEKKCPYIAKFIYLPKWKNKILHVFNPIFTQNYWIISGMKGGWKPELAADYVSKYSCAWSSGRGHFWYIEKIEDRPGAPSMGIIWFKDLPALVHEVSHATYCLEEECGMKHDDELTAYLNDWLFDAIARSYGLSKP